MSTSEFYITGFNKGDYKHKAHLNYSLSKQDSLHRVGVEVFWRCPISKVKTKYYYTTLSVNGQNKPS